MIINHKQNPAGLSWHVSRCYWGLTCVCGWIRFTGSSIHWVPVSQQGSISGIGQCTERRNLVLMKTNRNGPPSPPPSPAENMSSVEWLWTHVILIQSYFIYPKLNMGYDQNFTLKLYHASVYLFTWFYGRL